MASSLNADHERRNEVAVYKAPLLMAKRTHRHGALADRSRHVRALNAGEQVHAAPLA
jgi:hypothetical protein